MADRDQLLDGSTVPWDFVSGQTERPATVVLPTSRRTLTPSQTIRRQLIAGGRWKRP